MNKREYFSGFGPLTPEAKAAWDEAVYSLMRKLAFVGPLKQRRTFRVSKH